MGIVPNTALIPNNYLEQAGEYVNPGIQYIESRYAIHPQSGSIYLEIGGQTRVDIVGWLGICFVVPPPYPQCSISPEEEEAGIWAKMFGQPVSWTTDQYII